MEKWFRSLSRFGWQLRLWFRLRAQRSKFFFWFVGRQFHRLHIWLFSRRLRPLLFGLPALVVGVAVLTLLILSFVQPTLAVETRYLEQGQNLIRFGKWDQALTCYDHLAHGGANHPEYLYGLALSLDGLGVNLDNKAQRERALAIMDQLAPADTNGYAPAHLWQAYRLLATPGGNPAEARNRAEGHLLHALNGVLEDPEVAQVHALLGEIYYAENKLDQAKEHLTRAVSTFPARHMLLARVCAIRGEKDQAAAEAKLAMDFFRSRALADSRDHPARVSWGIALAFLEQFPQAIKVLQEGLTATQDPAYPAALAEVYRMWSDFLGRENKTDNLAERLRLLEWGLGYNSANLGLLDRLLTLTRTGDDDVGRKARARLTELLAKGQVPATTHFALGIDALQRHQVEKARVHLEQALALNPAALTVANNLAFLLSQSNKPEDLARALQMVNHALEKSPGNTTFRDTRGRIPRRWASGKRR